MDKNWSRVVDVIQRAVLANQTVDDILANMESAFERLDVGIGEIGAVSDAVREAHRSCTDALMDLRNRLHMEAASHAEELRTLKEAHAEEMRTRIEDLEERLVRAEETAAAAQTELQELDRENIETKRKADEDCEAARKKVRLCIAGMQTMDDLAKITVQAKATIKDNRKVMTKLMAAASKVKSMRDSLAQEIPADAPPADHDADEESSQGGPAPPAHVGVPVDDGDSQEDDSGDEESGEESGDDGADAMSAVFSAGNAAQNLYDGTENVDWHGPQYPSVNEDAIATVLQASVPDCAMRIFFHLQSMGANPCHKSQAQAERFCELFTDRVGNGSRIISITRILKSFVRGRLGLSDGSHMDYQELAAKLQASRVSLKHRIYRRRRSKNTALHAAWDN